MNTDLTFVTNEKNQNLKDRFEVLIKDTKFFDCLVGFFYTSGFYAIYKSLEATDKIRILIGISTSRQTYDLLNKAVTDLSAVPTAQAGKQQEFQFSHAETKQEFQSLVEKELEGSEDVRQVEEGVVKFIEWIKSKKLEVRAYPSQNIHAKLYIMTFAEDDRDVGRVITGSSNFTQAGLVDNLEFNVELKTRADYEFAKQKFEELWKDSVDVSQKYIQTIEEKTWLNQNITPHQLYLKFLYEYFKDELSQAEDVFIKYLPQEFKRLEYQEQAVLNAKKILEEYGGVFISDVVGLGKTYISAMLAGQLDGRTLVIAPPVLLEKAKKSTIPNLSDLEGFFNSLHRKLKGLDRQSDYAEYIKTVKENSKEIRDKVLKYLMVRRTRTEITNYFSEDLKRNNLKFPDAQKPEPLFYELSSEEDMIFNKTIELITQKFKYARYTPMLYYKGRISQPEEISQKNMGKFMKILLVKRLESSFFAFKKSIDRFINSYDIFIKEFEKGNVYVSKKYTNKIFELLENDDDEAVQRLIDEGKAEKYPGKEFTDELIKDLKSDFKILKEVKVLWQDVTRDPKLLKFLNELSKNKILKNNKLIVFTESKETAEYLSSNINKKFPDTALLFSGVSGEATRDKVIENFDARARHQKDEYRILVSTEVLSEGVNLHRSNTVINYDIPWNPTRMMQRVGRINRVDTKFSEIYTFNFFPTKQSNDLIKLREAAEAKISAFLTLLGGDAALLTEGEPIGSHELFNKLISKQVVTGEDENEESELKYLQIIKSIRDKEEAFIFATTEEHVFLDGF